MSRLVTNIGAIIAILIAYLILNHIESIIISLTFIAFYCLYFHKDVHNKHIYLSILLATFSLILVNNPIDKSSNNIVEIFKDINEIIFNMNIEFEKIENEVVQSHKILENISKIPSDNGKKITNYKKLLDFLIQKTNRGLNHKNIINITNTNSRCYFNS